MADDSRTYRLLSLLGSGGFGTVWRGDLEGRGGFHKQVAIKLLNEQAGALPEIEQRLRDEARLLGLLRHRAIVGVEDLTRIDGRWAVVMEYVEGADLAQLLTLEPLPPRALCGLGQEVAGALRTAHQARDPRTQRPLQIIHRDIKPANIRLTAAGEVKVLDFGIARAEFEQREAVTRSVHYGSHGYLAPERLDGEYSPAVDIYALGCVLGEALVGRSFGQLSVRIHKHKEQVRGLLEQVPDGAGPLRELIARMMDYEPERRPHAADVERDLRELLLHAPGPWLSEWAPAAIERLASQAPLAERPGDPPPVSRPTLSPTPSGARSAEAPASPRRSHAVDRRGEGRAPGADDLGAAPLRARPPPSPRALAGRGGARGGRAGPRVAP